MIRALIAKLIGKSLNVLSLVAPNYAAQKTLEIFAKVRKGKIEKETKPPTKPDFSAYLSKAKAKAKLVSSKK